MENKRKIRLREIVVIILSFALSFVIGAIFGDYVWGSLTLAFGFLNAYYMALGRWENYIYGILFTLTYAYICTINDWFCCQEKK